MSEMTEEERIESIATHLKAVMELLGEDTTREGLVKTPVRAAKALRFLTSGYDMKPEDVIGDALFEHEGSQMIVVQDIEFYSMCEHHVLPFFGKVSIGYIPDGRIVGISKLARLVNVFARRLQVQERFTAQLCKKVMEILGAKGAIVLCSGEHMCMKMRGVEKQHSSTTTLHYEGAFKESALREEFMRAIGQRF